MIHGSKLVGIAATARKPKAKQRIVVLGTATASLAAGLTRPMKIGLDRAGMRLLAKNHSLTAALVLCEVVGGKPTAVSRQTVTFTQKTAKKRAD